MIKEYRYIYNMQQASFYIQNGLEPIGCGIGDKKEIYIKFKDSEELQYIFNQWIDRKYNSI